MVRVSGCIYKRVKGEERGEDVERRGITESRGWSNRKRKEERNRKLESRLTAGSGRMWECGDSVLIGWVYLGALE
jgi:hypothetical protein